MIACVDALHIDQPVCDPVCEGCTEQGLDLHILHRTDQALLNNMSQVDIIHGIGTGVIRDAVTKYLRRHRHVKSFEYAPQSAGGSGCTIATLG